MDNFIMRPKVDFAFKEIMKDDKARVGFLAAVLGLDPADIKETRILNTDLRKVHADDKQGILDVHILLNNSKEIDVEIQLTEVKVWAARSLFYVAKMYTDQLEEGQDYGKLKKCVNISVLDFDLFKDEKGFYSCFHLREDTRHFLYTDKMEFHVIELPKLPQECRGEGNSILSWAKFINAERKEEFDMLAKHNPYIDSAYRRLQVISQDKQMRVEYKAREKALRDYSQGMIEAREEGREEGRKEGREEGRKEGREKGKDERTLEIARNMIAQGLGVEVITAVTSLTVEQVESLK